MESVASFSTIKAGKAYVVKVSNLRSDGTALAFHVDSGASVSLLGINSFCDIDDIGNYNLLKTILEEEIKKGCFESLKNSGSTVTDEEIDMYPCKKSGVLIADTKPITLFFHIYLGNIRMPLLGFDYIDDTSYHHGIGGDLVINGVADEAGKRFYPEKVIDFDKVLKSFCKGQRSF